MCKKIFLLISLFILSTAYISSAEIYDMSTPLEGNSIASDSLQKTVLSEIYPIVLKKSPNCTHFQISDTQLLHYPYDVKKKNGKYISGYWKELWTVNYCDKKMQIPITFTIKKNKTYYNVEYIN